MKKYFSYKDSDIEISYTSDEKPVPSNFKMHTHEMYELYHFIGGSGIYMVEGTSYPLECGDILITRPNEAHYINITDTKPYTRLYVNFKPDFLDGIDPERKLLTPFNNRKIGTFNRYREENFGNNTYSFFINNIITYTSDQRVQTLTNLLPLLNEISLAFGSLTKTEVTKSLSNKIIDYINRHLFEDISLDEICKKFYISKTHLCRIFKKSTSATVGEYITVKRLVNARQLILSGTPPTKAYLQCGFKDYSVFYRAYKKKYGISPSTYGANILL